MKTIALYSIKGGVGKTAAAVNLSYLSSLLSQPTLICDLDPQGASSYYFRITASKKYNSDKFLKGNKKIYHNIKATDFENLDLLPSDFSYRNLDIELSEEKKPQKKLRKNLEDVGAHVAYGLPRLKTHAKLTLIVRREQKKLNSWIPGLILKHQEKQMK